MEYPRALAQIAEIHQHLAKGEIYRGYRPLPVAASGLTGLAAALAEPFASVGSDPHAFLRYWILVAVVAAAIGLSELGYNYVVRESTTARRRTRQVVGQFLPAVASAVVITAAVVHAGGPVPLLPGIWALSFGVGTFASRPFLPRSSVAVALFYLLAGAGSLWTVDLDAPPNGFLVGVTFGVGQLLGAALLYRELERPGVRDAR